MSVSKTAKEIETLLYSLKDEENKKITSKVYQGDLEEPPMSGKIIFTVQASKKTKLTDFPSISKLLTPNDVPFYIRGYVAGEKNESMLMMYDLADKVEELFIAHMDNFNNTCTSSHLPEDYILYGEDASGKGLYTGFQFIIICNYSNNE